MKGSERVKKSSSSTVKVPRPISAAEELSEQAEERQNLVASFELTGSEGSAAPAQTERAPFAQLTKAGPDHRRTGISRRLSDEHGSSGRMVH